MGAITAIGMVNSYSFFSEFLSSLIKAEPYPVVRHPSTVNDMSGYGGYLGVDNCELAARLLFSAVEWARNISFFRNLAVTDQIALLRLSWKELFILNAAQCPIHIQVANFLNPLINPIANPDRVISFMDHVRILQDQFDKFQAMHVDPAEYGCLKAIVLFTSGTLLFYCFCSFGKLFPGNLFFNPFFNLFSRTSFAP